MPDIIIVLAYAVIMIGILVFNIFRLTKLIKKESYYPPAVIAVTAGTTNE